jgi:hypothetical protein
VVEMNEPMHHVWFITNHDDLFSKRVRERGEREIERVREE